MKHFFCLIVIAVILAAPLAWAQRSGATRNDTERRVRAERPIRPQEGAERPVRRAERRAENPSVSRMREHFQNQNQQLRRASNAGKISDEEMQVYNRKKAQVQNLYQEINADGVINEREEQMLAQNVQELDNLLNRIVHN